MSGLYSIVLVAIAFGFTMATSQEPVDESATPVVSTATQVRAEHGDRVTLKSGRVLQGVKVVRATPFKLFLEIIPTVGPLEIPAKQVVSISYGQPEMKGSGAPLLQPEEDKKSPPRVLPAVKIAPDFAKRVASPISDKEVVFNEQDLLNTLRSAGIMGGVSVTFGPRLEELSPEERTFSLRLAAGISFEEFYRDTLAPQVPWLKMEYRFETVHFERE